MSKKLELYLCTSLSFFPRLRLSKEWKFKQHCSIIRGLSLLLHPIHCSSCLGHALAGIQINFLRKYEVFNSSGYHAGLQHLITGRYSSLMLSSWLLEAAGLNNLFVSLLLPGPHSSQFWCCFLLIFFAFCYCGQTTLSVSLICPYVTL